MSEKISITQLDEQDRPREKAMQHGVRKLTNAELLAILVGSGSTEENAVTLMQRILADCKNSLARLGDMPIEALTQYRGVGKAKAITILAACELARRAQAEEVKIERYNSSTKVAAYFQNRLRGAKTEECHVMFLKQNLSIIDTIQLGTGGLTETIVDIRAVLEQAILKHATAIILCHNHPSGSCNPSQADKNITTALAKACDIMRVKLIDHIIVSTYDYFSFKDEALL